MIYLASPYSSPNKAQVLARVQLTAQCCAALIHQRKFVWSPILHSHAMAEQEGLPTDAAFWQAWSRDFIRHAEAVYVLRIDGWDKSLGVRAEIEFAEACDIPIIFVDTEGRRLDDWETPRT